MNDQTTKTIQLEIEKPSEPVGALYITEKFEVFIHGKMPNRFQRWMTNVLLGWKYKEYESGEDEV